MVTEEEHYYLFGLTMSGISEGHWPSEKITTTDLMEKRNSIRSSAMVDHGKKPADNFGFYTSDAKMRRDFCTSIVNATPG